MPIEVICSRHTNPNMHKIFIFVENVRSEKGHRKSATSRQITVNDEREYQNIHTSIYTPLNKSRTKIIVIHSSRLSQYYYTIIELFAFLSVKTRIINNMYKPLDYIFSITVLITQ